MFGAVSHQVSTVVNGELLPQRSSPGGVRWRQGGTEVRDWRGSLGGDLVLLGEGVVLEELGDQQQTEDTDSALMMMVTF